MIIYKSKGVSLQLAPTNLAAMDNGPRLKMYCLLNMEDIPLQTVSLPDGTRVSMEVSN